MSIMPHATDLAKSKTPLDGDASPEQRLVAAGHKFVELAEDVGLSADIAALSTGLPRRRTRGSRSDVWRRSCAAAAGVCGS